MGGAWERVQILILAEGLKFALSGKGSSLVQHFCQSCVHFDLAHVAIHMVLRFVIQGCPTLIILLQGRGTPSQILNITSVYQMP